MKIQTLSIVAGSSACNARCPYCISKMTPLQGLTLKEPEVNWRNFRKACALAKQCGVTTAMITSKGEPTLFPDQITKYLEAMKEFEFPMIELQTNGILIAQNPEKYKAHLEKWYDRGLTTIAVSVVHWDSEKNRQIYLPHSQRYPELSELADYLHREKFSVRLSCIMADDYVCDSKGLEEFILFAKNNKIEQVTGRPVNKPGKSESSEAEKWATEHYLKDEQLEDIKGYLSKNGHQIMKLQHGATVYDIKGQNFCLTDSLTIEPESENLRQLIFFPDGHLRYDWQYPGAVLI
ncbi:radical SAM protein [Candidatus Woesearchaeota archaeon]|nr:radical SAM protein [Candidatus Woesearchaeota archaeon]